MAYPQILCFTCLNVSHAETIAFKHLLYKVLPVKLLNPFIIGYFRKTDIKVSSVCMVTVENWEESFMS